MRRFGSWMRARFAERPWWMNAMMLFAAFQVFIYSPFDLLLKPLAVDVDVWFGLELTGWPAKFGGVLHLIVYAVGLYGFWKMRPWMWPWASLYVAQMAFSMLVWPIARFGDARGWLMGIVAGAAFAALAVALWKAKDLFRRPRVALASRYGNWALITGASAGIGLEFARAFAARGISCVLAARRSDRLEMLGDELRASHGVETRVVAVDLASADGPERLADAVADLEIGILVSNAGVGYAGRFERQAVDRLKDMVALNCTAHVTLTGRLLPGMLARRRGAVIVIGSVAGRQPLPLHAVYSATKGFDLLFGEALWAEVRDRGVDVLVVQPGPVATEFEQVAGEVRPDRHADESSASVVAHALEALGRQPSVVTAGWFNWLRANVNRFLPRSLVVFIAGDVMEKQTPTSMR